MATLLSLPDEILLTVFEYLHYAKNHFYFYRWKGGILSCRLVCKRLANIGLEAFKCIDFIQEEIGFKVLLELSQSPFRKTVSELSCYFDVFDTEAATSLDAFRARLPCDDLVSPDVLNENFEKYRRGAQFQEHLQDSRYLTSLSDALPRFQNLRAVHISHYWRETLEVDDGMDSPNESSMSPVGHRLFEAIVDALATSESRIEAFTLGNFHPHCRTLEDHGLVSTIQGLTSTRCQKYQQAFGKLKRLKIGLPWFLNDESLNFRGLLALIRSATLLEELDLSFMFASVPALPPYFLRSLKIPNLRSLVLECVTFEEPTGLLAFLREHSVTLRNVRFCGLCLEDGSWEEVFVKMRDIVTLESSSMHWFLTRHDDIDEEICPWQDDRITGFDHAIDDFIRRKTDMNPFDLLRNPPEITQTV